MTEFYVKQTKNKPNSLHNAKRSKSGIYNAPTILNVQMDPKLLFSCPLYTLGCDVM